MTAIGSEDFASAGFVSCYADAYPERRVEMLSPRAEVVFAFVIDGDAATSILPIVPYLTPDGGARALHIDDLEAIRARLGAAWLVFHLNYEDEPRTRSLTAIPEAAVFRRRATAVIDWSRGGADVGDRVAERLGARNARRQRAFARHGLTTAVVDDPERAVEIVREVETHSWKAAFEQDLLSRGQFPLYATLVKRQLLRTAAVFDGHRPVAYRLDGRHGTALLSVAWSHDERYAKASPGFHLITRDLPQRYRDAVLSHVDLFGGSDTLKELVMTGVRPRIDAVFPAGPEAERFVRTGLDRDAAAEGQLQSGRGVKRLYNRETP